MNLLIDVRLSPAWVPLLQHAGVEAVHWSAVGPAAAPDREIMKYAQAHGHAVLTHDLDFSAILFDTGAPRPSVVQIRSKDVNPSAIGSLVISEINRMLNEIVAGSVVTIDLKRTRVRVLPFRRMEAQSGT